MSRHQTILNAVTESYPQRFCEVRVTARIVWSDDGEEFIETIALGWSGRRVKVRIWDERYTPHLLWLMGDDIERLTSGP